MERLVDNKQPSSPGEARLAELVAAHERTSLSDATKADVLNKVLARRHRGKSGLPMLRPAPLFGILLAAGAATAATLGHRWVAENLHLSPAAEQTAPAPLPMPATQRHEPRVISPEPEPPTVAEAPTVPPTPAEAARDGAHAKHGSPHAARSEDPSRVVAAIQALRNEHDPERANKLVDEYLKVYPRGALAEEALALSIEAAAARHDTAAAAAFADQYIRQYPNGRFHRVAEQARRPHAP